MPSGNFLLVRLYIYVVQLAKNGFFYMMEIFYGSD